VVKTRYATPQWPTLQGEEGRGGMIGTPGAEKQSFSRRVPQQKLLGDYSFRAAR